MKRLVGKFGRYNVIAFVIMGVGVIFFLLTPVFIGLFNFDTDIIGLIILLIGIVMWVVGKVRGK